MTTIARTLLDIALRTAGLLGLHALALLLVWFLDRDSTGGANIGAGLLALALIIIISGLWSLHDGRRLPVRPAGLGWLPHPPGPPARPARRRAGHAAASEDRAIRLVSRVPVEPPGRYRVRDRDRRG